MTDIAASLQRQVEAVEEANRKAGYPVPEGALICLPYPEARALLDLVTPLTCGGCRGLGAHRKHCPRHPNYHPWRRLADMAESIGDSIGGNDPGLANRAYDLSSRITAGMNDHPWRPRHPAVERISPPETDER